MNHAELEQNVVEHGERLTSVEQILPTLLTGQEFETAMSTVDRRFADVDRRFEEVDRRFEDVDRRFDEVDRRFDEVDRRFDEVHGALAKHSEEIRRHFDVVSESLRSEIRIIAEGHVVLAARIDRVAERVEGLERAPPSPRRRSSPPPRKKSG